MTSLALATRVGVAADLTGAAFVDVRVFFAFFVGFALPIAVAVGFVNVNRREGWQTWTIDFDPAQGGDGEL